MIRLFTLGLLSAAAIFLAAGGARLAMNRQLPHRQSQPGGYRFERTAGSTSISKARPSRSAFSTVICSPREIADLLRVIKPYLEKIHQARLELLPRGSEKMLWPRIDPEYQREIDGIVAGLKAQGRQRRPLGPGRAQRQSGAALLLRSLARQEGGQDAGDPRPGQLQRVHRHGQLHQGRPDRDGPQRLDQLRRRHALEHHLRHQARSRARASSWTACRA